MSPSNEMAKCVLILILEYNELQFKTHLLLVEYHKTQIKINQYNYIQLGFFCFFPHYTERHSEHLLRSGQCASCIHVSYSFFFKSKIFKYCGYYHNQCIIIAQFICVSVN